MAPADAALNGLAPDAAGGPNGAVRIWGASRVFWFYFVISGLTPTVFGIVLTVAGALQSNGSAPLITGIVICSFSIPITTVMIFSIRPLVIADGKVRIPKGVRTLVIDLTTLAGVGLIYRYTIQSQSPFGWTLCVWDDSGRMFPIQRWMVVTWTATSAPGIKRRYLATTRDWSLPLGHEDAPYLAASKPGRTAARIYEAALVSQGPSGPLVTRALEKAVAFNPDVMTQTAAWWSPDGTMGRAHGLPAPRPAVSGAEVESRESRRTPIAAPAPSLEVQRARRANRNLTLAMLPFFILLPVLVALMLGHPGHLPNGTVCASVLGPASLHPSGACDAWRHHRLMIFIPPAVVLGVAILTLVVLQFRAVRTLYRLSRATALGIPGSPRGAS